MISYSFTFPFFSPLTIHSAWDTLTSKQLFLRLKSRVVSIMPLLKRELTIPLYIVCAHLSTVYIYNHLMHLFVNTPSTKTSGMIVVQSLSRVWLFETPWTAACKAFLSFTISRSLLKFTSIESVMSSNHLILCHPLLLLPSGFPSIRVFSNE